MLVILIFRGHICKVGWIMNTYENKEVEYNFYYKMIFSFNSPKFCICCFRIPIIYYEVHMHFHGLPMLLTIIPMLYWTWQMPHPLRFSMEWRYYTVQVIMMSYKKLYIFQYNFKDIEKIFSIIFFDLSINKLLNFTMENFKRYWVG